MARRQLGIVVFGLVLGGLAWGHGKGGRAQAPKPTADELAAYQAAKPVFAQHCHKCHTSKGRKAKKKALGHLKMDTYPFDGHHAAKAGSVIRKSVVGDGNKEPTMPSDDPGGVTGEDLGKILSWADAFERAHETKKPAEKPVAPAPRAH